MNFIALIAVIVAFGVILWAICRAFAETVNDGCPFDSTKVKEKRDKRP